MKFERRKLRFYSCQHVCRLIWEKKAHKKCTQKCNKRGATNANQPKRFGTKSVCDNNRKNKKKVR